jgi:nicotinate-nucleotide--dimethylbenzimidazole phosphoribosyltransferase
MNELLQKTIEAIRPVDSGLVARARARLDRLTKPVGSLGRLEELAAQYVAVCGKLDPPLPRAAAVTFAADHGVTAEGVSAYPSEVTAQMVHNFLRGGAGINVLANHVGAAVRIVDIGVAHDFGPLPGLVRRKVGHGTKNLAIGPAMSREEAIQALVVGIELAMELAEEGFDLIGTGDMGIGNTTPSSAVTAAMTGRPVPEVTGRGAGLDDRGYRRKIEVIEQALSVNQPDRRDAVDVLAKIGGYELGGIAGVILGAAARRKVAVLDGFISGAAALIALALQPVCRDYVVASHLSVERGHRAVLEQLDLKPLLDLDLRLGEGTGACLGIGLVLASVKILTGMATFDDAGVSQKK